MSAFDRYKRPEGTYGFVQWKGTDLCMDFTCECGNVDHIDGAFVYAIKCEACGKVWGMNPYIQLVELTSEEAREVEPSTVTASATDDEEEETTTTYGGLNIVESSACPPDQVVLLNPIRKPDNSIGLDVVRITSLKV